MQPAQVMRLDCRPGKAVVAELHQGAVAVSFQRELHGRFAGLEACDPTPSEYDLSVRNDLDIASDDLHAAGLGNAELAAGGCLGHDDLGQPLGHLPRVGQKREYGCRSCVDMNFATDLAASIILA